MKCKYFEKLFINAQVNELDAQAKNSMEKHVTSCRNCEKLVKDLSLIQSGLQQIQVPSPPDQLLQKTRLACHAVVEAKGVVNEKSWLQSLSFTPKLVWIGLVLLLALTQLIASPLFPDTIENQTLSFRGAMILMLMIQNITMLFFAPLLLERLRTHTAVQPQLPN